MRTTRRRAYDQMPGVLRGPTRSAYHGLLSVSAGVSRGTVRRDAAGLVGSLLGRTRLHDDAGRLAARCILVIDDKVPEHDVHAGSLTLFHYLRILRAEGLRVIYRPDDGLVREPYSQELQRMGIEVIHGEMDIAAWFAFNGRSLDWVLVARPNIAPRYLRHIRRRSGARILYLVHDLHFVRETRRHAATGDEDARRESRRMFEVEQGIFDSVDAVLTFSPDEVAEIERLAPGVSVHVVTPSFYQAGASRAGAAVPSRPAVPLDRRRGIVFLGAFDHLPNVDAAEVLVRKVMPIVWEAVPDAQVMLIGGHLTAEVEALAGDRVAVTGHVPDLEPYWEQARMSVTPLRFGSGVKGKIIASLEAGVPVVTTPIGNEGIGLLDGSEALIGETPQQIAEHAIELYREPHRAVALAEAGRRVMDACFSEERARTDLLSALGTPPHTPRGVTTETR